MVATILLGIVSLFSAPDASTASIEDFAFIAGHWSVEHNGVVTEEMWTAPKAGAMFGVSRAVRGEKLVSFEFLRIQMRGGDLYYVAQPGGRPPTPFKLALFDGKVATFENSENDFPSKIVYEKLGDDSIRASISGTQNGKDASESWEFKRVK